MLIDVHAHLDHCKKEIDEIIENAKKAGIKVIIANGINKESNRKVIDFSKKYDIVKAALGIYPIDALKMSDGDFNTELDFIEKQKIVAIGEIGLDYKWSQEKEKQKIRFIELLNLAKRIKKPIIVHSRRAEKDVLDILDGFKLKVILHCFAGNMALVDKAISKGYYFSISTNVVFSDQMQKIVKRVDINHLFAETDAPYLSPFKSKENEPAFVVEAYKKIAELKGMDLQEVVNNVWMNYQNVFK